MTWRRHLGEMVVAGGALASAGCGGRAMPASPRAADGGEVDATAEASTVDALSSDARTTDVPAIGTTLCPDASYGPDAFYECCNANPDPCCAYEYCCQPIDKACSCALQGGDLELWQPRERVLRPRQRGRQVASAERMQ